MAPQNNQNAPVREENPAANPNSHKEQSPASIVSSMPVGRGPSTLAELNALMVIKRRKAQHNVQVTSSFPSLTFYMFSQADETPCILLLQVNSEYKDVAKGSVVRPLIRMFHTVSMPPDMFRVSVLRVLAGCGDLYPPR